LLRSLADKRKSPEEAFICQQPSSVAQRAMKQHTPNDSTVPVITIA
jgi:hypothetical protein